MNLDSKEKLLSENLKKFYSQGSNFENMMEIADEKTTISLRLLDWLVTNYSKKNKVFYELSSEEMDGHIIAENVFDMYSDYKNQLKASNKKYFDPFSRGQRTYAYKNADGILEYDALSQSSPDYIKSYKAAVPEHKKPGIVTTIGQLNFLKWAMIYKIINYATEFRDLIERDMLLTIKERKINRPLKESKDNKEKITEKDQEKSSQKRTLSKTSHTTRSSSKKIVVQFI